MRQTALSGAFALSTLVAGAFMPAQAQTGALTGAQAGAPTGAQLGAGAGAPTPQQAQKAQQSRSDAEAYLQREEAVATGSRSQNTDRANRAASVPDEAGGASAVGSTRAGDAGPAYGPVLNPRQPQSTDPARRNPAEIHDETDPGANPAAQSQPQPQPPSQQGRQRNNPQAALRRPAWQPANQPMAPRPLREPSQDRDTANNPEPVPPPAAAPQPVVPSSTALNSCQGGSCTDAAGTRYNGLGSVGGSGNAGVSASGRLCNRSGATVQCF